MKIGALEINTTDLAAQGNAVLGIRDSGKTYTATYLAENMLDAGVPFVAFDPIGVWRFLRVGADGHEGYPVVVAGGEGGDIPLSADSAQNIVRAAMQENIALVLDLYSMNLSKADWRKIVETSIRVLLYENKRYGLRHVFIEEAAEFVPQVVRADMGRVYAEIEKLGRMGRNASLGFTLINQRAEEVNKAVLELCDCLFLHRQKGRHSLTALDKWLSIASTNNAKEIVKTLPGLDQGRCWVWMAGSNQPVFVKVPKKKTVHPDPKHQTDAKHQVTVDVSDFVKRMQSSLRKQEASDIGKELETQTKRTKAAKGKVKDAERALANPRYDELEKELQNARLELNQSRMRESQLRAKLETVKVTFAPQYDGLRKVFEEISTVEGVVVDSGAWQTWLDKLHGKNRRMLEILIEHRRISDKRMYFLVGMKKRSYSTYKSNLIRLGLMKAEGDDLILQDVE